MNLTLLAAIACILAWLVLMFVAHVGSGPTQLLWAAAVILFTRRVLAGAPTFRS
jgi:hypothetical protein